MPPEVNRTTDTQLAHYIAQAIFDAPYFPSRKDDKTQRIAFKGGHYPDKETDLGGMGLSALESVIRDALREFHK